MAPVWARRGRVDVPGGRVAYRIAGEGDRTLLTVHGGPGVPSPYIYSMTDLARNGLRVVFYDQLGCGESDKPDDKSLWVIDRFVEELEAVRAALDLGPVDVWGHSWGGMLAQEYALAYPGSLRTLGLASTICSSSVHRRELARLVDAFPAPTAALLRAAYDGGETTSQEYRAASTEFWRRHVCRIPFPHDVQRAVDDTSVAVLETMWGPDDVVLRGNLAGWDVSDRIDAIRVPTLITVGKHDALTPTSARLIADRIAGSELVVFDKSSHHAHWEERERHMGVVRDFLQAH